MDDRDLPPLTALRAFQAAADEGSMQAAARRLAVTPSAVSHQVRALETWLGAPLFVRGVRKVTLTAAGERLHGETRSAFSRIARAAAAARADAGGALTISALPFLTNTWLIPRLAHFRARRPEVSIRIETSNQLADLETDGVDVAIRNSRSAPAGVSARKLFDIRGVPVCAPGFAARLTSLEDLAAATLIHVSARRDAWPEWLAAAGLTSAPEVRGLDFDTVPDALEAAAAGHGVALAIDPLVWSAPVSDRLAAPLGRAWPTTAAYYVVHRRGPVRPAVRAFVDWLTAEATADRRRLARLQPPNSPRNSGARASRTAAAGRVTS